MKGLGRIQLGLLNRNASYVNTVTFFQGKAKVNQEKKKVTLVRSYTYIWHTD